MPEMDDLDRRLLNSIQSDFPMVERPYAALADRVVATEDEVIERIATLKRGRIIRQVNAIFDTRALGYQSSLVAARYGGMAVDDRDPVRARARARLAHGEVRPAVAIRIRPHGRPEAGQPGAEARTARTQPRGICLRHQVQCLRDARACPARDLRSIQG